MSRARELRDRQARFVFTDVADAVDQDKRFLKSIEQLVSGPRPVDPVWTSNKGEGGAFVDLDILRDCLRPFDVDGALQKARSQSGSDCQRLAVFIQHWLDTLPQAGSKSNRRWLYGGAEDVRGKFSTESPDSPRRSR